MMEFGFDQGDGFDQGEKWKYDSHYIFQIKEGILVFHIIFMKASQNLRKWKIKKHGQEEKCSEE